MGTKEREGAMRMSLLGGLVGYERIFSIISTHGSRTPESSFEISRIWSIRYFSSPPGPDDYVTGSASVPSNRPSERQQSGKKKLQPHQKVVDVAFLDPGHNILAKLAQPWEGQFFNRRISGLSREKKPATWRNIEERRLCYFCPSPHLLFTRSARIRMSRSRYALAMTPVTMTPPNHPRVKM